MAGHVSWRAGGVVARAYWPADLDDLAGFLERLRPDEPLLMVGLGSNLLVRDGGFDGTVVFTHGILDGIRLEPDGSLYVEAGVASPKVARFAANHGLVGAEFLAGIPGTFGGALAMNAGCYGAETWQWVERVLMLDRRGGRIERGPADFSIGYRHAGLKASTDEVFAAAWLRLPAGDGEAARQRIAELLEADGINVARRTVAKYREQLLTKWKDGVDAARALQRAPLTSVSRAWTLVRRVHVGGNDEGEMALLGRNRVHGLPKRRCAGASTRIGEDSGRSRARAARAEPPAGHLASRGAAVRRSLRRCRRVAPRLGPATAR